MSDTPHAPSDRTSINQHQSPPLRSLRFVRQATPPPSNDPDQSASASRQRILTGLKELRAITSRPAYETAKAAGVAFSNEGFQKRMKVGTGSLRHTNSDLFDELQRTLNYIHSEFVGGTRSRKGRSKGTHSSKKLSALEAQVMELKALLERRDAELLDMVEELKTLRGADQD